MTTDDELSLPIVVNIGNFQYTGGFRFGSTKIQRMTNSYPKEFELKPGQILLVMTCQTPGGEILGIPGKIPSDGNVYLHNQRMGLAVVTDPTKLDKDFLYWLFLSHEFNRHLYVTATGSKILHTAPGRIEAYRFSRPPLETQRRIAAVLSAYDDLIENNTQRIAALEAAAQALYREWFVEFRFPGHESVELVESALGRIPRGWEVTTLGQTCEITMGQSPSSEYYNERGEGLPFHQGVTDFGVLFPTHRVFCTLPNRLAETQDILFSVRAPVGRINVADTQIIIGRGLSAIRNKKDQQTFTLYQLKEHFSEEDIIGGGTIFKSVTKTDMHNISFLQPADSIIGEFESSARPLADLMANLLRRNAILREARDLLLPRLISGELSVEQVTIPQEDA